MAKYPFWKLDNFHGVRMINFIIASAAAATFIFHANAASAQTPANTQGPSGSAPNLPDTIVVTGSRIKQPATPSWPIAGMASADLTDLGATNVGQALSALPAFGVPGNSTIGAQGSFSAGQTFVNLYDLGAQRTLTLVNGNRFVSSATSSIFGPVQGAPVDLGQIAPGLVDHIDVVSVGGAPIYGSDAIAGTVNVRECQEFRVRGGIMGKRTPYYGTTQSPLNP